MSDTKASAVDGSGVYALANKPTMALLSPTDALLQAGRVAEVVNANRLFQANVAKGQAQQQSIDMDSGQYDPRVANRLFAQNPDIAPVMAQGIEQNQAVQGQQQDQAQGRFKWIANAAGSLMSDNNGAGPTWDRTKQVLAAGVQGGYIQPQDAHALIVGMPQGDDPQSMSTRQHMIQTVNEQLQTAQQRLQNVSGAPAVMRTGQVDQPGTVAGPLGRRPFGSFSPAGQGIQQVTGPETNAALVDVYQPDPNNPGQYIRVKVPRGNLPGASGAAAAPPTSGGINPPAGPNPMGTGRGSQQPASGGVPTTGAASAAPLTPASPPQTAATSPVLSEPPQSAAANNTADITNYQQAKQAIPAVNNTMQNLQHAYDALQTIGTGPSTEAMQRMKSFLVARGVPLPQGVDDSVKNYDLFRKYTEKYALDQAGGSNTDAGRAMTAASNAGTGISTSANNDVLRNEIGKQRLAVATVNLAPNQTGIGYGVHAAALSSQVDPRGFAIDMYSPDEVQKLVKAMPNDTARNRFFKAAGLAGKLGMVSPRPSAVVSQTTPVAAPAPGPRYVPQVPTTD